MRSWDRNYRQEVKQWTQQWNESPQLNNSRGHNTEMKVPNWTIAGDTTVKWKSSTEQCSAIHEKVRGLLAYLAVFFQLVQWSGLQAILKMWNTHRMMHHHVLHTTLLTDTFSSFYGSFYYYVHKPFSLYTAQNKSWITTRNLKAEYMHDSWTFQFGSKIFWHSKKKKRKDYTQNATIIGVS